MQENMILTGEQFRTYGPIYHDFTEAYTNIEQLTRDFYPVAKKFVEGTEPEIDKHIKKLSSGTSTPANPKAYQIIIQYMGHFDDFTLTANRLFREIKDVLEQSDIFMNKVLDLKQTEEKISTENRELSPALMPELTELLNRLKQMPPKAIELEKQMKLLETEWKNTKDKIGL